MSFSTKQDKPIFMLFKPFVIKEGRPPNKYLGKVTSFSARGHKINIGKMDDGIRYYQICGPFSELFEQLKDVEDPRENSGNEKENYLMKDVPHDFQIFAKMIQTFNPNVHVYMTKFIDRITIVVAVLDCKIYNTEQDGTKKTIYYYPAVEEIVTRRDVHDDFECHKITGLTLTDFYRIEPEQRKSIPERIKNYYLGPYPPCNIKDFKMEKIKGYRDVVLQHGNNMITNVEEILTGFQNWIFDSVEYKLGGLKNFKYTPIESKPKHTFSEKK